MGADQNGYRHYHPMTPDIVWLMASVMVGEAEVLGEAAMLMVGHVIMNRVLSPDFPDNVTDVIEHSGQWHGRGIPRPYHRGLARAVLRRERDRIDGMLFCLSEQDKREWGFRDGDMVLGKGVFLLHLYREWPGKPERKEPR